jgi:dipeptide transport system ATP-binding protein
MALLDIRNLSVQPSPPAAASSRGRRHGLACRPGEVLAIVGESGSGKSVSHAGHHGPAALDGAVTADRMAFDGQDLSTA